MATKIFTTIPGRCPFGYKNDIDDNLCRVCPYYYRAGTGMFFLCNHPPVAQELPKKARKDPEIARKDPEIARKDPEIARKDPEIAQEKRKRGRPPGKATKKAVKRTKTKKR